MAIKFNLFSLSVGRIIALSLTTITGTSPISYGLSFSPKILPSRYSSSPIQGHDRLHVTRYATSKDTDDATSSKSKNKNNKDLNLLTKSSWYAVELFGNLFGSTSTTNPAREIIEYSGPPSSMGETMKRIELDNDRSYFLSGMVDKDIYAPNCIFSDPFVSFEGRDRFVANLANLGSFVTKYDAKVLKYTQVDDTTIQTKVSSHLNRSMRRFFLSFALVVSSRQ